MDHSIPPKYEMSNKLEGQAKIQVLKLDKNTKTTGIKLFDITTKEQRLLYTLWGRTKFNLAVTIVWRFTHHNAVHLVCWYWYFWSEHVLTLRAKTGSRKSMKIEVRGKVASGITAKILFLPLSAKAGSTGHVVEFCWRSDPRPFYMEGVWPSVICSEMGAKKQAIAPDETTFAYLKIVHTRRKAKD